MKIDYLESFALFKRDARLYLVSSAIQLFALFGIYMVLFNLFLVRLGYGPRFVGLINAVGSVVFAVFCLFSGALGKRFGNRRIMIVGLCLCVLGIALVGLAEAISTGLRSGWLLIANSVGWIGSAMFAVNGNPFLMQSTTEKERNYVFSVWTALVPLTGFFGGVVGGFLPGLFGRLLNVSLDQSAPYRYSLLLAAAFTIPAIPVMLAASKVSTKQADKPETKTNSVPIAVIGFIMFFGLFRMTGEGAARTFFNIYLDVDLGMSTAQIGILFAFAQLLAIPAALVFPSLAKRWGKLRTVVVGTLGIAMSLLPLALVPHWGVAALGFAGVIALGSVLRPAITVYSQELVSEDWRSIMSGALMMALGFSNSGMALCGGYVINAFGYRPLFGIGALLTALGVLVFWGYFHTPRGEYARGLGDQEEG